MDIPTEEELAPRMAIAGDIVELVRTGKARIVERREGKPINGRRMVEVDIELLED